MPLTTVYIPGPRGQYATNVDAGSSGEAVRKAVAFFLDPFWKGPKPKAGTVLRECPMGGKEIRARVPAENCDPLLTVESAGQIRRRSAAR